MTRIAISIVLAVLVASSAAAQMSSSNRALVNQYLNALEAAETGKSPGRVEAAYSALAAVREAMTRRQGNRRTALDSLTDEEFNKLYKELRGAEVNRDEIIVLAPKPDFFVKLAAEHGDAGDRAFFAALKATYPSSIWPVYFEARTDVTGCTTFGEGKLVGSYRVWSEFQQKYPKRYAAAAEKQMKDIVWRLTAEHCACTDAASMQKEFEQFLISFPASSIRSKVGDRLKEARSQNFKPRSGCIVG